jgi:hypothetical protein
MHGFELEKRITSIMGPPGEGCKFKIVFGSVVVEPLRTLSECGMRGAANVNVVVMCKPTLLEQQFAIAQAHLQALERARVIHAVAG